MRWHGAPSPRPQDLLHRLALRQLVHQFVEGADLAHGRLLDRLDAHAADPALDQGARRVGPRRLGEERLDVGLLLQLRLKTLLRVAGQPADDRVDLGFRAVLFLRFGDIMRIDAGETHRIDAVLFFHGANLRRTLLPGNGGRLRVGPALALPKMRPTITCGL